ncbi:exodeoxyribonuclease VII large subunit [Aliidiomarina quisquiliarum]|uniref:exodeoxyribonuclease VII large subunit n=1 Tax=Aliidiomarina quisquiliarum TaxID=2938947 RepID=UPI00208E05DF|nr:exodeoxyribonuclease VII large subunit [Aliidiomarina quisquiliarum]MCO4321606.1 exodeoxyribonuclease VII large subunit [Aliidiomarina quisquiliarum]
MTSLFTPDSNDGRAVYSVSQLNQEVRLLLESAFPLLWVEGEISNFSRPSSGHCYFTLKDSGAQIRCAMFRSQAQHLRHAPKNGDQVLVRARISLYQARGDFQLIVEHMEDAGDGALKRAFEQLKVKLQAQGLFDAAHKKPLPALPKRLGVITSPTGAAIQDVLTVLKRRFPALSVLIYPVPVQGAGSAEQIADAIRLASERNEVDMLLLTRGGGSLEDLWSFNEEGVARAIFDCQLPLVSAVGHEVDFTIADFVADQRAATPSAAAELISPDSHAWLAGIEQQEQRLAQAMRRQLDRHSERIGWLRRHLDQHHPRRRLLDATQRLDELEARLQQAQQRRLRELELRQQNATQRLQRQNPQLRISQLETQRGELGRRLNLAMRHQLQKHGHTLQALAAELNAISPLATLARGYSVVRHEASGSVIKSHREVRVGEPVRAELAEGVLHCRVEFIEDQK